MSEEHQDHGRAAQLSGVPIDDGHREHCHCDDCDPDDAYDRRLELGHVHFGGGWM